MIDTEFLINAGLYITYVLIGLAVLAILLFGIMQMIKNPRSAKSALIGIAGMIVLTVIAYLLSTGEDAALYNTDASTSHWVGTGLIGLYLLGGLTILSIIYSEVTRLFK